MFSSDRSPSATPKADRSPIGLMPHLPAPCRYLRQSKHILWCYAFAWPIGLILSIDVLISTQSCLRCLSSCSPQRQVRCLNSSLTKAYDWISPSWHIVCMGIPGVRERKRSSMCPVKLLKNNKAVSGISWVEFRIGSYENVHPLSKNKAMLYDFLVVALKQ